MLHPRKLGLALVSIAVAALAPARARADEPLRLSLDDAVGAAVSGHPRVRASKANQMAAAARTDQARLVASPAGGVSAEINRSTGNTTPGAFLAAPGFVPIAGPARGNSFDDGSWQTGASLWATWDITSLARQNAAVDLAHAGEQEAEATTALRELEVAYEAADAFMALVAADKSVKAATASLDRARVFHKIVTTLVQQSLRPGVDEARAQAELSAAEIALARAQQVREVQRARLLQAMGASASTAIEPVPGALLGPAPTTAVNVPGGPHPLVKQADAGVARAQALEHVVALQYVPRIDLFTSLWMRGSGIFDPTASGLVPNVPNWAGGVAASWNIFEVPTIRARAREAKATEAVALATRDDAALAVSGDAQRAQAVLQGALQIAQATPANLAAARTAEQQVTARYQAGLAQVTDVADAQRVLAQAEVDDAVAHVEVWRAVLFEARAAGDLAPAFTAARKAP